MTPDEHFDQIANRLRECGATAGAMFGSRALLCDGKAFACLKDAQFAVKLGAGTPGHADALTVPGAALFDPSGKKRPFKDWVALPAAQAQHWPAYADKALTASRR